MPFYRIVAITDETQIPWGEDVEFIVRAKDANEALSLMNKPSKRIKGYEIAGIVPEEGPAEIILAFNVGG